eukprot:8879368-Pyramimonas_sp.AAC.1
MRLHEELLGAGSLVEWRLDDGPLLFFSHQWTAFGEPDHTGIQFKMIKEFVMDFDTVKRLENRTSELERKFSSMSSTPLTPVLAPQREGTESQSVSEYGPDQVFCWLDIWSIPQASTRDQSLAIQSLAAYVTSAAIMVVVAPPCTHANTGERCDLRSWRS